MGDIAFLGCEPCKLTAFPFLFIPRCQFCTINPEFGGFCRIRRNELVRPRNEKSPDKQSFIRFYKWYTRRDLNP